VQASTQNKLPVRTFTLPEVTPSMHGMTKPTPHTRPVHEYRWRNFRALLAKRNLTITAAADVLEKTQGQVSHFGGKSPSKVIGDDIATEIEIAFNLPPGSLDYNSSGEGTINESSHGGRTVSHFREEDAGILAEAEKWVRFEEKALGPSEPVIRAQRLMALFRQIQADGGFLSPDHSEEFIDAVRERKRRVGSDRATTSGDSGGGG
jgi:hypothetical protein